MMATNFLKTYQHHLHHNDKHHQFSLPKRNFVTYAVYALIAVVLLYLFVDPAAPPAAAPSTTTKPSSLAARPPPWIQQQDPELPAPPPSYQGRQVVGGDAAADEASSRIISSSTAASPPPPCDYADGEWVPDASPPLYNGTTCGAIKDDGRSCTLNGRADTDYVYWRWQPRGCDLPAFSAAAFLRWLRNRHMAFVGDSLARNQAESLVCLLSSSSPPDLVHRSADGRFRRWLFRDHNATVSIFWSPFLLKGVEKSEHDGVRYNQVFLDAFDERWMSELGGIDAAVLSAGHWFRIPSVYHEGGRVVGCHGCDAAEFNGTVAEVSFFRAYVQGRRRTDARRSRPPESRAAAQRRRREAGGDDHVLAVALRGAVERGRAVQEEGRPGAGVHRDADEEDRRGGGGGSVVVVLVQYDAVRRSGRDGAGQPAAGRPPGAVHAQEPVRRWQHGRPPGAARLLALVHARAGGHV